MSNQVRTVTIAAFAGIVGGCAHLPDVTVGYYLTRSKVSFKVIRVVACDGNNNVIVANATTPTVTHSADSNQFFPIGLSGLRGTFSDTDVKFEFTEDGRLKSINATSTGQGEAIFKSVVSIITPIFALDGGDKSYPTECAAIKKATGDKPLTLTYEGEVDLSKGPKESQNIPPDTTSNFYAVTLMDAIGKVSAIVGEHRFPKPPATYSTQSGDVMIEAQQPGSVQIKVLAGNSDEFQVKPAWQGKLPVAQFGTRYSLPIPAPATFGKQVFAASFAESGALTSVQYVSNTGAGQALNVLSAAQSALKGETTAQIKVRRLVCLYGLF